jgi:tRNA threonylcarbamoyladenosine biosynthesis protein TsaB
MLILGIESATAQVGCAIGGHEGVLASVHSARPRRHAESLAPQIEFALSQAQIDISEISVVAVDIGPGLYTGLRVGIATAMATAFGLNVPMIGISSLDLLAFPVRHTRRLIAATIDARRGELFTALYRQVPGGMQRVTEPRVVTPDELFADLQAASTECLVVGDGALRYKELLGGITKVEIADESLAYPSASSLVALAHARALREEFVQPAEIAPLYLRRPDAEVNWQTRPLQ